MLNTPKKMLIKITLLRIISMVFIVRTSGKTDSGPQTTMRPRPSDRLRICSQAEDECHWFIEDRAASWRKRGCDPPYSSQTPRTAAIHNLQSIMVHQLICCAVDTPVNHIHLIGRLTAFNDKSLNNAGQNATKKHSWYLSHELATLALFSVLPLVTDEDKALLVENMTAERGFPLITTLPISSISDLHISHTFWV